MPVEKSQKKRSVVIAGHATSISLEPAFWEALHALARIRQIPLRHLIETVDQTRHDNLSSSLRVFVLQAALRGEITTSPDTKS